MYNCRIKIRSFSLLGVVAFLCLQSNVLGFNLADEISASFKSAYNGGYKDDYLNTPYAPTYPKDPFGDALKDEEDKSTQTKIAGVEYIENELASKNCSLSQKKLWSILYYFVPEFRAEIARSMKMELGDSSSKNFVFDEDEILDYCREYYICVNAYGHTPWQILRSGYNKQTENGEDYYVTITSSTPANIKSNCQEFFQENYKKGQEAEQRVQSVQISQLGSDKYWNATTDDSPYDLMIDFGTIGKLLYQDAEQPITPVFYNLPMFSNSRQSLSKHKSSGSSYDADNNGNRGGSRGGNSGGGSAGGGNSGGGSAGGGDSGGGGDSSNPIPLPLPKRGAGFSMEGGYDDLVEGLGAYSVVKDNIYYGSLCEETEPEPEPEVEEDKPIIVKDTQQIGRDVSELSDEELEILVDYMLSAVDTYATLPDEKVEKIAEEAGDTSRFLDDTTPGQLQKTAKEIKDCWDSCKGLRIDQKASCMLMCACGEIKSPIFNPEKTPGLGPIFMIRFCTVPAKDTRFAVGGKNIISIEKGVKEIYGVVDKLSREGRLGIWTQQYNFLDSTTKKMKVMDTVAFTIDIEFVDITDKNPKHSQQFEEREIATANEMWQTAYGISNKLDNPVLKNKYRIAGYEGESVDDLMLKGDDERVRGALNDLAVAPTTIIDQESESHASRYSDVAQKLNIWLDQQGNLWKETLGYINEFDADAKALYSKPKI